MENFDKKNIGEKLLDKNEDVKEEDEQQENGKLDIVAELKCLQQPTFETLDLTQDGIYIFTFPHICFETTTLLIIFWIVPFMNTFSRTMLMTEAEYIKEFGE